MQFKIFYFGKIKNKNLLFEIEELKKRISRLEMIELKEIKDKNPDIVKRKESEVIGKYIQNSSYNILLTEEGSEFSTKQFHEKLKNIEKPIHFFITGPYGPTEEVKSKVNLTLSLSKMTYTHEQALYMLIEQIYSAEFFEKNIPYKK